MLDQEGESCGPELWSDLGAEYVCEFDCVNGQYRMDSVIGEVAGDVFLEEIEDVHMPEEVNK